MFSHFEFGSSAMLLTCSANSAKFAATQSKSGLYRKNRMIFNQM